MKILHIIPSYKPAYIYGGPIYSVSALCEWQAKAGHDVFVFTTTANGTSELDVLPGKTYLIEGVSVVYFRRFTKDNSNFSPGLLKQLFKNVKEFDIVHLHSWWNLVVTGALTICILKGKKTIFSPRGTLSEYGRSASSSVVKKIFSVLVGNWLIRKTYIHATSNQEIFECRSIHPKWKGFVAPNIINLPVDIYANKVRIQDNHLRFGFLSRIHPKKGLELLLSALATLSFDFRLSIAGSGDEEYINALKQHIKTLGLQEKVDWKGMLLGEQKISFLCESDVVILTSFNENFANVIVESLYCKTPVLLSDQVGLSDYISEKKFGWVVKLEVHSISAALEDIYINRLSLNIMGEKAGDAVRKDFEPRLVVEKYINAYKYLINE